MAALGEPAPTRQERIQPDKSARVLVIPALIGCIVALTLGIYGRLHSPTGVAVDVIGFSSPGTAKAWLATLAVICALIQLGSALVMYGKVSFITSPPWIGTLHRW